MDVKRISSIAVLIVIVAGCQTPVEPWPRLLERRHQAVISVPDDFKSYTDKKIEGLDASILLPKDLLPLTVARQIAVSANPNVHSALARLEGAWARIAEARARFYPIISFTHTSARTFHRPVSRSNIGTLFQVAPIDVAEENTQDIALRAITNAISPLFGQNNPRGNTNPFSEHSTAFTVSWNVFDGFVREAQALAARHLSNAANYFLSDVRRLILRSVDTAYFQVQLAQEEVRIAQADVTFSRDRFEETKRLQAAGRASQADVDNFRVRMLTAQAKATAARGLRDSGRVVLAELMGIEGALIPDSLALSLLETETEAEMSIPDSQSLLTQALNNRPDLAQLFEIIESESEKIRAVEGLFYPTLAVSGSWGFDRGSTLRYRRDDQSTAGALELRWDLYTGGTRHARVRQARAACADARARWQRLRLAVSSEVRTAIIDVSDAQEQIRLQSESLTTSLENRRIIRVGYSAGKETLTRLNEAQRDYIEADANLARARIRLRQAWSDLRAAVSANEPTFINTDDSEP